MKVSKDDFIKTLNLVRPALSDKAIVELTTHFIFTGENIITYNDKIAIIHPFKTDFECTVSADPLYKVLSKIKDTTIEINLEKSELRIITSNIKSGLVVNTDEDDIGLPEGLDIDKKWKNLPTDFLDGVFLCMFAASKDFSQPLISNISVNEGTIIATDDVRMSKYKMRPPKMPNFLLPLNSAIELTKLDPTKYSLDESWIYFKDKSGVIFCSRIVKDEFPDMDDFFKIEGEEIELPDELIKTVDSVCILAEGDIDIEKRIDVKISSKKISCRGEREAGWIESDVPTKINIKDDIKFTVNPIFFSQILSHSPTMIHSENQVKFISETFEHLLCLIID